MSLSAISVRWLLAAAILFGIAAGFWFTGAVHASDQDPSGSLLQTLDVLPQQEDADPEANLPYLFAVYIITWAGFFGYVFYMSRRQKDMQRDIDALKRALAEREDVFVGERAQLP